MDNLKFVVVVFVSNCLCSSVHLMPDSFQPKYSYFLWLFQQYFHGVCCCALVCASLNGENKKIIKKCVISRTYPATATG